MGSGPGPGPATNIATGLRPRTHPKSPPICRSRLIGRPGPIPKTPRPQRPRIENCAQTPARPRCPGTKAPGPRPRTRHLDPEPRDLDPNSPPRPRTPGPQPQARHLDDPGNMRKKSLARSPVAIFNFSPPGLCCNTLTSRQCELSRQAAAKAHGRTNGRVRPPSIDGTRPLNAVMRHNRLLANRPFETTWSPVLPLESMAPTDCTPLPSLQFTSSRNCQLGGRCCKPPTPARPQIISNKDPFVDPAWILILYGSYMDPCVDAIGSLCLPPPLPHKEGSKTKTGMLMLPPGISCLL